MNLFGPVSGEGLRRPVAGVKRKSKSDSSTEQNREPEREGQADWGTKNLFPTQLSILKEMVRAEIYGKVQRKGDRGRKWNAELGDSPVEHPSGTERGGRTSATRGEKIEVEKTI